MKVFFFTRSGSNSSNGLRVCCTVCGESADGLQHTVFEVQKKRSGALSGRAERRINRACKLHLDSEEHKQNELMSKLAAK